MTINHKSFLFYLYLYLMLGVAFLVVMISFLANTLTGPNAHNCVMPETQLSKISVSSFKQKEIDPVSIEIDSLDQTIYNGVLYGVLNPVVNRKPYGYYFVTESRNNTIGLQYPQGIRWEDGSVIFVVAYYQYLNKLSQTFKYSFYSCFFAGIYLLGFCFIYKIDRSKTMMGKIITYYLPMLFLCLFPLAVASCCCFHVFRNTPNFLFFSGPAKNDVRTLEKYEQRDWNREKIMISNTIVEIAQTPPFEVSYKAMRISPFRFLISSSAPKKIEQINPLVRAIKVSRNTWMIEYRELSQLYSLSIGIYAFIFVVFLVQLIIINLYMKARFAK